MSYTKASHAFFVFLLWLSLIFLLFLEPTLQYVKLESIVSYISKYNNLSRIFLITGVQKSKSLKPEGLPANFVTKFNPK